MSAPKSSRAKNALKAFYEKSKAPTDIIEKINKFINSNPLNDLNLVTVITLNALSVNADTQNCVTFAVFNNTERVSLIKLLYVAKDTISAIT